MKLEIYTDEGYQFMVAAFEVYNDRGYGLAEEIYQECLESAQISGSSSCVGETTGPCTIESLAFHELLAHSNPGLGADSLDAVR